MLSIGEDHTAKLFEFMDDEEIMEISQTMANLGKVSANIVERLFVDFAEQMSSTGSLFKKMFWTISKKHSKPNSCPIWPKHNVVTLMK